MLLLHLHLHLLGQVQEQPHICQINILFYPEQISLTPEEQLSSGADENFMFACWSPIFFTFAVTCASSIEKAFLWRIPRAKLIPLQRGVVSGCISAA